MRILWSSCRAPHAGLPSFVVSARVRAAGHTPLSPPDPSEAGWADATLGAHGGVRRAAVAAVAGSLATERPGGDGVRPLAPRRPGRRASLGSTHTSCRPRGVRLRNPYR